MPPKQQASPESKPGKTIELPLPWTEKPADRIGRYRLLQQIGEGGCGVVYMAQQDEPVRRRVALKVIKLGMDTKEVIARFEAERQALALMDHPNIAKVLDAGAADNGRPFFVMELVKGLKITDYCDENNLSTPQRLDLFIRICHAIQHAHQKGVIHRDIKPSNILVTLEDSVPTPKVIDFGIAKATDLRLTEKSLFTALDQFVGTPAYMSPEQAKLSGLDIDTRSDIYSLGVLLYELLTGKTPFEAKRLLEAGLDEIRRIIREEEPPRPSAKLSTLAAAEQTTTAKRRQTDPPRLMHMVRGDLDWIVMKCLEKDRTHRYETANGLAADLQRHLNNEPVLARPPSNIYRLRKLVRRHKMAFATASAVAASLLIALAVSTRLFLGEKQAHRRADTATKFLTDMLNNLDPQVAQGDTAAALKKVLDETADQVGKDFRDDPQMQADLRDTIGHVYLALGLYDKAEATQRAAIAARQAAAGPEQAQLAAELNLLATTLFNQGRLEEAEQLQRQALAMRRKLLGQEHADVAESLNDLSMLLFEKGSLDEAETIQRQALALSRKLGGDQDPRVASSLNNLAAILVGRKKLAEAEKLQREELALSTKRLGTNDPSIAISLNNLALLLSDEGKPAEAEDLARQAVTLRQRVLPKEHPDLAQSLDVLGRILSDERKLVEAEPLLRAALGMRRALLGTNSLDVALSLDHLAELFERQGRLPETERLLSEALDIRGMKAPDNPWTFNARSRLGGILLAEKKFAEAELLLLSGYEGIKQHQALAPAGERPGLKRPLERLIQLYQALGQPEKAAPWQQRLDELERAESSGQSARKPGSKN
ncbi:MAG TPA: serine/threonine-protein kinase [Dongiaceae bacterium]|nr:serine/threonine-protein kinase [Dongiaceae bacterium]